jgi:hypothetical protein
VAAYVVSEGQSHLHALEHIIGDLHAHPRRTRHGGNPKIFPQVNLNRSTREHRKMKGEHNQTVNRLIQQPNPERRIN